MVKSPSARELVGIEHIGVGLWRAARAWRHRFATEMEARGYPWHGEARGEVLAYLGPSGRGQAELTAAMGMTKQAVQQLVDQLEVEGVVRRVPDPDDRRAKRVELTARGLDDFAERNRVKREIEADYLQRLGAVRFNQLQDVLRELSG